MTIADKRPHVLILVTSCDKPEYAEKRKAQQETWATATWGGDSKVSWSILWVAGGGDGYLRDGVLRLPCDDTYGGLPEKTNVALQYALRAGGWTHILKVDDDAYVQIDRLMEKIASYGDNVPDYAGRLRGSSGEKPHPYASGFCYLLSRKAAQIVVDGGVNDTAEDRMVGNHLYNAGYVCHPLWEEFVITTSNKNATSGAEGPRKGNRVIACAEYSPDSLRYVHKEWLEVPSGSDGRIEPSGTPFDDVCVMIKTFLRDGLLLKTIKGTEQNMPGARMIIVDDGRDSAIKITEYARLRRLGHTCVWMPFDSGFGAKSNYAIPYMDRKYTLIASDDFVFDKEAAEGVLRMIRVLESDGDFDVVSGRVDGIPYEGFLRYTKRPDGLLDVMAERLDTSPDSCFYMVNDIRYWPVGHTVNYNLCRRGVFDHAKWDERFKIGGDHARFYEQINAAGMRVAYVEGVNIRQARPEPGDVHPDYGMCRGRARLALPTLYREWGWNSFTHFDGTAETLEDVDRWAANYTAPSGVIAKPRVFDRRKKMTDAK